MFLDGRAVWEGQIKKGCGNTTFDYSTVIPIDGQNNDVNQQKDDLGAPTENQEEEQSTPLDSSVMESIVQGFVNLQIQDRKSDEVEKKPEAPPAVGMSNEELLAEVERRGLGGIHASTFKIQPFETETCLYHALHELHCLT